MAEEESPAEKMAKAAEFLQKVARPIINFIFAAIPFIINFCQVAYNVYVKLPMEYVQLIIGSVMCFFGGIYPTVFAAIQAAEHGGLATVKKALKDLSEEAMVIIEANKKDDAADSDKDGVNDVKQIDGKELMIRKTKLVLTKMNPQKVDDAISSLYKVWMSVLAVLTIEFARTIAMAMTISDFVHKFVDRYIFPTVNSATPPEYRKWVPVLTDWFCKSIGVWIAWKVQTVISAFTSALAGGLIMSRTLLLIFAKHGINVGGFKDHENTFVDEIASYLFAGLGFYFQFYFGFSAPFPLNIVLYPVQLMEYYIRWSITK